MPHLKSAAKRLRQSRRRGAENKKIKKALKKLIKAAKGPGDLPGLFKAIDKATKRKLFHENRAARMKSSLSKNLSPSAQEPSSSNPSRNKKFGKQPQSKQKTA